MNVPGLLPDAAPTPGEIRRRISDHRLVIVLAHGGYDAESPERSSIVSARPDVERARRVQARLHAHLAAGRRRTRIAGT